MNLINIPPLNVRIHKSATLCRKTTMLYPIVAFVENFESVNAREDNLKMASILVLYFKKNYSICVFFPTFVDCNLKGMVSFLLSEPLVNITLTIKYVLF